MRPQNPNFLEERMGLKSAKKSIKIMVPYNGPALVGSALLVGRKTLKKPFLRREMAFSYTSSTVFFEQNEQNYANLVYC